MTKNDMRIDIHIKLSSLVCAKREKQSTEFFYVVSKRKGCASIAYTEMTLRQQLSKNNDARIIVTNADIVRHANIVTHAHNSILNDSDSLNVSIA